jgi:Amt family ammonium transporter
LLYVENKKIKLNSYWKKGSILCYFACELKKLTKYKYDDACDVFGVHGVGGVVGCVLTGIFADKTVVTMGKYKR